MTISFSDYESMMSDRPKKFTPEQVNYRDADSLHIRCLRCVHFYQRARDLYGVCEIMRPKDDEPVNPDYFCDFFSTDGEEFPLRRAR